MSKKSIRKVHIENQEWTWVVSTDRYSRADEVRIYSPEKQLHRAKPSDICQQSTTAEDGVGSYGKIQPGAIKQYIINKIINAKTK